jgi:hypothetical protein
MSTSTNFWAEAWKPAVMEGEEVTLKTIIGQALGAGSMCWKPTPEGIYDPEKAQWILGGVINEIEKLVFWQIENERKAWAPVDAESEPCIGTGEAGIPVEPPEAKMERLRRYEDKVRVVDLILSYRNKATEEEKLRQIRVVMD